MLRITQIHNLHEPLGYQNYIASCLPVTLDSEFTLGLDQVYTYLSFLQNPNRARLLNQDLAARALRCSGCHRCGSFFRRTLTAL